MSNKFVYLFMRGFRNFLRDFKSNIFSFITIITLIILYNIFTLTASAVSSFLSSTTAINSIRVYIAEDDNLIPIISDQIKKIDGVVRTDIYMPADTKQFITDKAPDIKSIEKFGDEFFPSFINVTLDDIGAKNIGDIKIEIEQFKGIEFVSYGKKIADKFFQINLIIDLFLFILLVLLTISIASIIFNTVQVSLYKYYDEMSIYLLVGATRPFISLPYIFSSMIIAIFTSGIAIFLFLLLLNFIKSFFDAIDIFIRTPSILNYIVQILLLIIFSLLAAAISVTVFIKRVLSIHGR